MVKYIKGYVVINEPSEQFEDVKKCSPEVGLERTRPQKMWGVQNVVESLGGTVNIAHAAAQKCD